MIGERLEKKINGKYVERIIRYQIASLGTQERSNRAKGVNIIGEKLSGKADVRVKNIRSWPSIWSGLIKRKWRRAALAYLPIMNFNNASTIFAIP